MKRTVLTGLRVTRTVLTGLKVRRTVLTGMKVKRTVLTGLTVKRTVLTGLEVKRTVLTRLKVKRTLLTGLKVRTLLRGLKAGLTGEENSGDHAREDEQEEGQDLEVAAQHAAHLRVVVGLTRQRPLNDHLQDHSDL